ncbi:MmgE/PrpD family protein [Arvimicrobium flavum]|uniref:MmgE/PrpD family protein n=1 Tax=Arvimicrobium flavum TaxID=3393320 RepID=UPI00237B4B9E|nr:MmgE/PrpD family protein [Mesorhizobium shangrilense]
MDATLALARLVRGLDPDEIPEATLGAAAHLALDTVGSALAGVHAPGIPELRTVMDGMASGVAPVWATGQRLSAPAATLVNSSTAHALEYDDLHDSLPVHSGIVVVPAALAVAATRPDLTGREILTAIIAGTEVICRLARATGSYTGSAGFRGWNPSAVVAGFGAAAVAGRLLGLDAEGIARAMGLSYAQASGNQQCIEDGGLVKRMQPGLVAEAGVRAAWLAQAGVTGATRPLEGKYGYYRLYEGGDYDPAPLNAPLNGRYEIDNVCFKRYPVCGMAQPAMDALRDLQLQNGFAPDDVAQIAVHGSKFVVDMVGRPFRPGANPEVDAQFNLSYCLSTIHARENFSLADLAPERTLDPASRTAADAITVNLDPALKGKWEARVEVSLRDGRVLSARRSKAAWQEDRRMNRDDLLEKFHACAALAGPAFGADRAQRLAALLLRLPELPDTAVLNDALAGV